MKNYLTSTSTVVCISLNGYYLRDIQQLFIEVGLASGGYSPYQTLGCIFG